LLFTEQVGRCSEWWNKMKDDLETLMAILHRGAKEEPQSFKVPAENVIEGWETVADQFALYVHKVRRLQIYQNIFLSPLPP
jgi:hypothetical protein